MTRTCIKYQARPYPVSTLSNIHFVTMTKAQGIKTILGTASVGDTNSIWGKSDGVENSKLSGNPEQKANIPT